MLWCNSCFQQLLFISRIVVELGTPWHVLKEQLFCNRLTASQKASKNCTKSAEVGSLEAGCTFSNLCTTCASIPRNLGQPWHNYHATSYSISDLWFWTSPKNNFTCSLSLWGPNLTQLFSTHLGQEHNFKQDSKSGQPLSRERPLSALRQKMKILITCEEENHHHPFLITLYLYSCCSIVYAHRYAQLVHAHLCRGHAGLKRKSWCNMATFLGLRGTLVLPLVDPPVVLHEYFGYLPYESSEDSSNQLDGPNPPDTPLDPM